MSNTNIKRSEMSNFNSEAAKLMSKMNELSGSIPQKFKAATNAGFMTGMVQSAATQGNTISNNIGKVNRLVGEYTENQFAKDEKGATKINDIEIPTDFYSENDADTKQYNQALLEKMDGKSVNQGDLEDSAEKSEIDVKGVGLTDITGEDGADHDISKSGVSKIGIDDINVATEEGVEGGNKSGIDKDELGSIAGGQAANDQTIEGTNVQEQGLGAVNTQGTQDSVQNSNVNVNSQALESVASVGAAQGANQALNQAVERPTTPDTPVSDENLVSSLGTMSANGEKKKDASSAAAGILAGLGSIAGLGGAAMLGRDKDKDKEEDEENEKDASSEKEKTEEAKEDKEKESNEAESAA